MVCSWLLLERIFKCRMSLRDVWWQLPRNYERILSTWASIIRISFHYEATVCILYHHTSSIPLLEVINSHDQHVLENSNPVQYTTCGLSTSMSLSWNEKVSPNTRKWQMCWNGTKADLVNPDRIFPNFGKSRACAAILIIAFFALLPIRA